MDALDSSAKEKLVTMKTLFEGLLTLNSHTAYFLLKNCFNIPKFTYFMRTTPLWFSPSFLNETDILLRGCLESILNIEFDDSSWSLANLPIRVGGL